MNGEWLHEIAEQLTVDEANLILFYCEERSAKRNTNEAPSDGSWRAADSCAVAESLNGGR